MMVRSSDGHVIVVVVFTSMSFLPKDFRGQDHASMVQVTLTAISGIVGFFVGFWYQRFLYTFAIIAGSWGVAAAVSMLSYI